MVKLRGETLEFLNRAPKRWEFEAPVAASTRDVFTAISADPSTWTWFPGLTSGRYEGDGPPGVGTLREVRVGRAVYRETILAWEEPNRWVYRVDEMTAPLAHALVEEWTIRSDGDTSVVRWTFAIDPRALFRVSMAVAPAVMGRLFRKAMRNLSAKLNVETPSH
jgi:polyketide cyclase/dehydrase/lipid transport protein